MEKVFKILISIAATLTLAVTHQTRAENFGEVAVTIAPLHSLISGVTEGVNDAGLIVPAEVSPHSFSLKPSHIGKMSRAKAVFYIDDEFEHFLLKALRSIPSGVRKIPVAEKSGVRILKAGRGGVVEPYGHGSYDMHIWLSPKNAEKIVKAVTEEMSRINPGGRDAYKKNSRALIKKLKKLDRKIRAELAGLEKKPYVVFHGAYMYFERDYGMSASNITVIKTPPSARKIREIRAELRETGAVCVFSGPQFNRETARIVTEGLNVKIGALDPLGAGIHPGPNLYFELMENIAANLKDCLK